jgi:hypothetical protein
MSTIYYIESICPGLVRIHEETITYSMDQQTAQENIDVIKANRAKYASDEAYLRRLQFYEDVLEALNPQK